MHDVHLREPGRADEVPADGDIRVWNGEDWEWIPGAVTQTRTDLERLAEAVAIVATQLNAEQDQQHLVNEGFVHLFNLLHARLERLETIAGILPKKPLWRRLLRRA